MAETMTLIAGRSSKQGVSMNTSKLEGEYVEITTTLEMNEADMARLGLKEGDRVRLCSATGETVLRCKSRKAEDLPQGLLFLAYGPSSSQLMGGDTAGTGMPLSKNFEVEVERVG